MKSKLFFISFIFFFVLALLPVVSAEFGYNTIEQNQSFGYASEEPAAKITFLNYTNISEYWKTTDGILDNVPDIPHNNLGGLQGGQAGQYYHINQSWFNELLSDIFNWITGAEANASMNVYNNSMKVYVDGRDLVYNTTMKIYVDGQVGGIGVSNSTSWNRSGTNVFLSNLGDKVGIGIINPDGFLHIFNNSAGAVTASDLANELVIESNTDAGLSILTTNSDSGSIYFGDQNHNAIGRIVYDHSNNDMFFFTNVAETMTLSGLNYVGIGTITPLSLLEVGHRAKTNEVNLSNTLFVNSTAGNVGIDVSSPSHSLDVLGDMLLTHTATTTDEHGLELIVDASGLGDIKAIDLNYITGAISTGDDEGVVLVNIDEFLATGGDVFAFEVLATEGSANVVGLKTGVLVSPIHQDSGVFMNMDSASNDGVNNLAEFISTASDVTIFASDNDYVILGDANKFEEIEFILNTTSSKNIKPTFEYSDGVGSWDTFSPVDSTDGMEHTGLIAWEDADIPSWIAGAGGEYLIRITRTRNNIVTVPIEHKVQIAAVVEYYWNKDGNIFAKNITITDANITGTLYVGGNNVSDTYVPYIGGLYNVDFNDNSLLDVNDIGSATDEIDDIYIGTNQRLYLGDGQESSIYYNGTTLIIG